MIELFHAHASTCSQKVRICLAEKGLDYVSRPINLGTFEHLMPQYLEINPNGVVPALRHDGGVVIESTVICEYLDEVFPQDPLSPPDPLARASMRAWLRFIDEVPSMAVRVPTFQNLVLPAYQRLSRDEFDRLADSMPVRKQFIMRMGQDGFSSTEYQGSIEQLDRSLRRMEKALGNGPWLVVDAYSIADICVLPVLHRMEEMGMAAMWQADLAKVTDWYARACARPSFGTAFYPESKLAFSFPALRALHPA
ncbi:MAG: glutathione S-transferase family protein [Rhizobiaceae bacterium]|nr:glutathione S-transferase family protein [Rhizobiaceae bacterium]